MGMKGIKVNNAAATKGTTGACDTTGDVSANNGCTAGGAFSASFSGGSPPAFNETGSLSNSNSILTRLPHPRRLVTQDAADSIPYRSPAWISAMLRLYRRIFTAHGMFLNLDQRMLGDRFVRTEFRRHVEVDPRTAGLFYKGWIDYLRQLEAGHAQRQRTSVLTRTNPVNGALASGRAAAHIAGIPGSGVGAMQGSGAGDGVTGSTGRSLTEQEFALLSDDQKSTLMRLRKEALEIQAERGFRL